MKGRGTEMDRSRESSNVERDNENNSCKFSRTRAQKTLAVLNLEWVH